MTTIFLFIYYLSAHMSFVYEEVLFQNLVDQNGTVCLLCIVIEEDTACGWEKKNKNMGD